MAGAIWVVGEVVEGELARISREVATLARGLGERAGRDVVGVVVASEPAAAAAALAEYLPRVLSITEPRTADHVVAAPSATRIAALVRRDAPDYLLMGASPEGRDLAGTLSALLGWGTLVNAVGVGWDDGPAVEMSIFGGRQLTTSALTGGHGIVTVRPNIATADRLPEPGSVEPVDLPAQVELPGVRVVDRVAEAGAAAPIEEARIIVAGGRGVGGPDGFGLVEELADVLGGAVGATRAAVDAGWINYAHQIGQTGKIVKPALYLALGISGAIQHKVGMQTAETIVAINRDPDAPIAEFADLFVVGDLFEVVPAIVRELRARSG